MTGSWTNSWVAVGGNGFNASQKDYKVMPTSEGSRQVDDVRSPPSAPATRRVLQVFEVGTAAMMASKERHRASGQVMRWLPLVRPQGYISAVVPATTRHERAGAQLPAVARPPCSNYNKDLFRGRPRPNQPPGWPELGDKPRPGAEGLGR